MLKEIVIVIQSYINAHKFIREHKLWKWIIIPGIIYSLLFIISMYFFGKSANYAIEWITKTTHLTAWLEKMQSGFLSFLFRLSGLILWLVLMLFYFSLFKYVWLILGSPVFAYLSEKTASILEGKDFPFSLPQLAKDIIRGIKIALRNALWQTIYTVSIVILSFIPLVGWATPVLAMLVECYYYGFSMLDYSCERRKMSAQESIFFINQHKGLAIGNGIIFYMLHLVPILGWVFAPAYAVIAATLSLRETER
ncbi:EI24 domain-containing protein [Foetidibacter luteolus]|uniref:EI24 domain-containing protein n=1 Tax=Foetidibacter luteolus TaxID=2608880 RepID=UPI00129A8E0C|nr:EI24 domain-containing protein [Foetidibacter luteolus]